MKTKGMRAKKKASVPKIIITPRLELLRPLYRDFRKVKNKTANRYSSIGAGCYRAVYDVDAKFVLKLPHDYWGERDNIIEALLYQADPIKRAWCELVDCDGVWGLKMEKLRHPVWGVDKIPLWVHTMTGDGNQCGFRDDGTLLVYDYAYVQHKPTLAKQFKWLLEYYR